MHILSPIVFGLTLSLASVVALAGGDLTAYEQTAQDNRVMLKNFHGSDGFYVSGNGGLTTLSDQTFRANNANGDSLVVNYHGGYNFGLAMGYHYSDFRVGISSNFYHNKIESIAPDGGAATSVKSSRLTTITAMMDAMYDFKNHTDFTPYVGLGVGAARVKLDAMTSAGVREGSGNETRFAYQGLAGVNFRVNDMLGLSLDYKYLRSPAFHARLNDDVVRSDGDRVQYHVFNVGVTYYFAA